jgi:hypothetical protein
MINRRSMLKGSLAVSAAAVGGLNVPRAAASALGRISGLRGVPAMTAIANKTVVNQVVAAPPTKGESTSTVCSITALNTPLAVYFAKTASIWPTPSQQTLGSAKWCQFDFQGSIPVVITRTDVTIKTAVVKTIINGAPVSFTPTFTSSQVSFTISTPGQYYICINNDWPNSMYVFANPMQTSAPTPTGAGVQVVTPGSYPVAPVLTGNNSTLYFGPGRYFFSGTCALNMGANQSIYMADGAFVYLSPSANSASIGLYGTGSTLTGRGVIDGSLQPNPTPYPMVEVSNSSGLLDGLVFRDNSFVAVDVRSATGKPTANNFKVMGWRLNSDGCHIDSSIGATISNSFVRSYDDEIAINNNTETLSTANFTVTNMLLFKQKAHSIFLNLGFATASSGTISGIYIIQDYSSEGTPMIGVQVVDNGTIGPGITVQNVYADQVQNFMGLSIMQTAWTLGDYQPGAITGITFDNIQAPVPAQTPYVVLSGYGPNNIVENTVLSNIKLGGQPLTMSQVSIANKYVARTVVTP